MTFPADMRTWDLEPALEAHTPVTPKTPESPSPPWDHYFVHAITQPSGTDQVQTPVDPQGQSPQPLIYAVSHGLQVPNYPPNASDWEAYRPVFAQLYLTEGRTLKDAMQIMEVTYGFQATPRMFKKRISDWGLRKYHARKSSDATQGRLMVQPSSVFVEEPAYKSNKVPQNERATPPFRRISSDPDASDSLHPPISSFYNPLPEDPNRTLVQSNDVPSNFLISRKSPTMKSRNKLDVEKLRKRHDRHPKNLDDDIERYLKKMQPNLSLTKFRTISNDLKIVETILEQVHGYYDSFSEAQWMRKFPSSPRTVMKEMTLCVDLGQAFPRGEETPIHPTQLFSRYVVAFELLKSKRESDIGEGWRMIHEAFDLFRPVLAQQHTQLLRYFFQHVYDYRLNAHPDIRKRIFELASDMASMTLGEQHPITLICRLLPQVASKDEICVLAWKKSLELIDANLGAASEESLRSKLALSGDLIEQSKFNEAESLLTQMLRTSGRAPTDYYMRSALIRLAWLYRVQGRYDEAENHLYEVLRRCRECDLTGAAPPDAIYIAAQTNLAQSLCSRRDFEQGEIVLHSALQSCTRTYGGEHGYTVSVADELEKIRATLADLRVE